MRKWMLNSRSPACAQIFAIGFLICVSSTGIKLFAQTPSLSNAQSKSPAMLVALSIRAIGGRKAINRVRSITAIADCLGPRSRYKTEIYSARGNRLLFKQSFPDGRSFLGYVKGEYVWTKDAKTGEVTPGDRQLAAMMRGHEFQMIVISPLDRFHDPVTEGYENFAGALCIKLKVTDELDGSAHLFFRVESKLMAGLIVSDVRNGENNPVVIVFNEWRTVGKLKLPSKVTATEKAGEYIFEFYSITVNSVDDAIFAIPPTLTGIERSKD